MSTQPAPTPAAPSAPIAPATARLPWSVHPSTNEWDRAIIDARGYTIAHVINHGDVEARAALLAAAPELRDALAACVRAETVLDDIRPDDPGLGRALAGVDAAQEAARALLARLGVTL
jgi:hypothetical protein